MSMLISMILLFGSRLTFLEGSHCKHQPKVMTVRIENIHNIHPSSSTVADKFIISMSLIHSSTTLIGIMTGRNTLLCLAKMASDHFVHGNSNRPKWELFIALAVPSTVTRDCLTNETELIIRTVLKATCGRVSLMFGLVL